MQQQQYTQSNHPMLKNVLEYMRISYSPKECKGEESVMHLVASSNKFIAPTTFPDTKSVQGYAADHKKVMDCLPDLHIIQYDYICFDEKNRRVALRYSAEGTHTGKNYFKDESIRPTGKHAKWHAAALFELDEQNKITLFIKEWDKLDMWNQLGWPQKDCIVPAGSNQ